MGHCHFMYDSCNAGPVYYRYNQLYWLFYLDKYQYHMPDIRFDSCIVSASDPCPDVSRRKRKNAGRVTRAARMYIQELESIQSSMRSFRHDYKNMMSSLYLQSREGNIQEIEKNIHSLIDEFDENIDRKMNLTVQMANIRISEVKSLLYKKITEIQKKGIDFRMEVMYPVKRLV